MACDISQSLNSHSLVVILSLSIILSSPDPHARIAVYLTLCNVSLNLMQSLLLPGNAGSMAAPAVVVEHQQAGAEEQSAGSAGRAELLRQQQ